FNLPAIVELGTATGFDFELIDQAGLGNEKLTQARNQLLAEGAKLPDMVTSVRPKGMEDTPQCKIDIQPSSDTAPGSLISDQNTNPGTRRGGRGGGGERGRGGGG
ncbi:efflux RND transporter permease subunit, partial [Escherichia coli]|uniref:efflux RND transporter permease subunit n=1 Tax=Escherichia coli TaxID=562 RepID=UPI0010CAF597